MKPVYYNFQPNKDANVNSAELKALIRKTAQEFKTKGFRFIFGPGEAYEYAKLSVKSNIDISEMIRHLREKSHRHLKVRLSRNVLGELLIQFDQEIL